jgi:hypothetical protein
LSGANAGRVPLTRAVPSRSGLAGPHEAARPREGCLLFESSFEPVFELRVLFRYMHQGVTACLVLRISTRLKHAAHELKLTPPQDPTRWPSPCPARTPDVFEPGLAARHSVVVVSFGQGKRCSSQSLPLMGWPATVLRDDAYQGTEHKLRRLIVAVSLIARPSVKVRERTLITGPPRALLMKQGVRAILSQH